MENKIEVQEQFIELRAKGNSYDRIAEKLKVSKATLINWSNEYSMAIQNMQNLERDSLLEKHKMAKQHQMELYGVQLGKVREELSKRDLSDVSTEKLLNMELKLLDAVNNSGVNVTFKASGWAKEDFSYSWDG